MKPRSFDLFRSRRFWPLFVVQFFGALNDHVFKNAFMAVLTWRLADRMALDLDFQCSCTRFLGNRCNRARIGLRALDDPFRRGAQCA